MTQVMTPQADKEAEKRRLAWRCRRGMLELDIVLKAFVAEHHAQLSSKELQELDVMLDLPDNELWELIQLKNQHLKSDTQLLIIDKLHQVQTR